MKLIFTKTGNGDINVLIQKGTVAENFSYLKMLKQLLDKNEIDEPDFTGFEEIEKERIKELLNKIKFKIDEAKETKIDNCI
jgi:hypothetical protein